MERLPIAIVVGADMLGESIGTVVSTHETIRAAFKANETFQKRIRGSGVKDHVPHDNRHAQSTAGRR
jgi:hypothetical protein